jgi:hypothetical protein
MQSFPEFPDLLFLGCYRVMAGGMLGNAHGALIAMHTSGVKVEAIVHTAAITDIIHIKSNNESFFFTSSYDGKFPNLTARLYFSQQDQRRTNRGRTDIAERQWYPSNFSSEVWGFYVRLHN